MKGKQNFLPSLLEGGKFPLWENRHTAPRRRSHREPKGLSSLKIIWRLTARMRVPRYSSRPAVPRESPVRQVEREGSFYDGKRKSSCRSNRLQGSPYLPTLDTAIWGQLRVTREPFTFWGPGRDQRQRPYLRTQPRSSPASHPCIRLSDQVPAGPSPPL